MHSASHNLTLIDVVVKSLEKNHEHVVNIAAGPKREDWFNAECIVALSHASRLSKFIVYGEQAYRTALKNAGWTRREIDDPEKRPDIMG